MDGTISLWSTYPIDTSKWVRCTLKLLNGFNCESKGENNERRKSWGAFLGS